VHPVDGSDALDYNRAGESETYEINTWAQPNNPVELLAEGTNRPIGLNIGQGFHFVGAGSQQELGCYFPCSADDCDDTPGDVVCATCDYQHYYPSFVTARIKQSTFNNHLDYWSLAHSAITNVREKTLENRIINGDCVLGDDDTTKVNPYLAAPFPADPDEPRVEVLNGGTATSLNYAIGLLDEALAGCNPAAGMIHAEIPVASFWTAAGYLEIDPAIDYGDGMGQRSLLRTKTRGNIVVAGAGYKDALGPDGAVAADGTAWVYATSMVHLIWDKIQLHPERGNLGQAVAFARNDIEISASQLVGAFFDVGCRYAVLVDLADMI
jgi:hypothetical protein